MPGTIDVERRIVLLSLLEKLENDCLCFVEISALLMAQAVQTWSKCTAGPIRIAGHSLGGTLAILVASQLILEDGIDPLRLRLHAFGSPPALSHKSCSVDVSSNCGAAVRQRLGLPAANIRNWVLDFDPVPRATTAANPYLQVARKNEVPPCTLKHILCNS